MLLSLGGEESEIQVFSFDLFANTSILIIIWYASHFKSVAILGISTQIKICLNKIIMLQKNPDVYDIDRS